MIIVRSPLRISLAGGGTDLRSFYKEKAGSVCSFAINKYVYVTVNNLSTFFPHRYRVSYSQTELTQNSESIKHPIVREALKFLDLQNGGIDINVMADIPAGTGMGSSSAFTVSLLHALHAMKGELVSKEVLAQEACYLEMDKLQEPIGKQDQYAASFGGLNLVRFFSNEQVEVRPLPVSELRKEEMLDHFLLFYMGGNRSASEILKEQTQNSKSNYSFLEKMSAQSDEVAKLICSKSSILEVGKLLNEGWNLKKNLASGVSNSTIDECMEKALKAGATGGKLLGAGGTGFLFFITTPEKKDSVRSALHFLSEVPFQFDSMGTSILYFG